MSMHRVYISLGTNLGDKERNLRLALKHIEEQIGKVVSLSAFYATAPWGFTSDNSFLNAAACVETRLLPLDVLERTQSVERRLGRKQKSVNGAYKDRLIDIDLLLYDDWVVSDVSPSGARLTLPHPLMAERDFVLRPLAEIAPQLLHPVLGKTVEQLHAGLLDKERC
ncbi:2-amino-4-hydroxy-6-hydroxymethyldihydropteridine pyrophosphokinase [Bacteroides pyogenes DSM 20611 = JCM 6294]|uniref:2-amino-4-hydroxy-6-hydroxymethyldihydropteridine pyrophosphokinase n=2 Tax=Bacteroides pyogenes TaxID=310300 RepID=W4PI85_9BACE|nr:2-amino-4-hydroxy-6-hydroxymethyldihydropteridine pyrophosphokinase [Bacteroides pyogenes DSM 20611 = JCM 6294]